MEGGGFALHAEGHLVPAQVHQGLHPLTGENAVHRVLGGLRGPRTERQGAIGAVEVYGELRVSETQSVINAQEKSTI